MSEIKFVELCCQRCGGALKELAENKYACKCCGKEWMAEKLRDFTDMLEACEEALRTQRVADIANLRQLLWKETRKEFVSNFEVERLCRDLQKFLPQDFYANFYLATCSGSKTELGDFLYNVDAKEHYEDIQLVLDYLLCALKPEWIMGVGNFIEKIKDIDLGLYNKYRTTYDLECDKIEECIFEPSQPRDVFVAYSSRDMLEVSHLVAALEEEDLSCFVAARNMRHGSGSVERYNEIIHTAIDHCSVLIFVSSDSSRSVRCDAHKELEYINQRHAKKPRVEFLIKNYSGKASERFFEDFFKGLEYCTSAKDAAARVIELIMRKGSEHESAQTPVQTPAPEPVVNPEPAVNKVNNGALEKQLKRARILIEARDFDEADSVLSKIESNEEARAGACEIPEVYHYKLLVEYGAKDDDDLIKKLVEKQVDIAKNKNYLFAMDYAEESENEAELKILVSLKVTVNEGIAEAERIAREQAEAAAAAEAERQTLIARDFKIKDGVLVKYKGNGGDVVIPDGVTEIGKEAFKDCKTLASVTISNGVMLIGDSAFEDCESLVSVIIPDSVTTIGKSAFIRCKALTTVNIPDRVTVIGQEAFVACKSLTSINVSTGNKNYKSIDGNLYSFDGKTLIRYAANKTAEFFTVPNGVTSIGDYAFDNCASLTSITIPNGVISIGESAFSICESLTNITIPNSVTSIGQDAFMVCEFTSIIIPISVTYIGSGAFTLCNSLKTIYCAAASKPEGWNDDWLSLCNAKVVWGYNSNQTESRSRVANPPVQTVNNDWHASAPIQTPPVQINFDDFEIRNGVLVKYRGNGGDVVIPDSVTSIGRSAFKECASIKSVIIPNGVTSIGSQAFCDCEALASITIPDSVTSIRSGVFAWCVSLTSINVSSGNKNYKSIDGDLYSFDGKTLVQYAAGKKAESFTIPYGVTFIGDNAFIDSVSLTSIIIPNSVTSIGDSAFYCCESLKSITIPDSVTTIEKSAFDFCVALKTIYCRAKKPLLGLPKGWHKDWLGTGEYKCKAKVIWNYKG